MRVNRRNRLTPARSRRDERTAEAVGPDALAEAVEPAPAAEAEPPRREHLYGSTYRVRMSFDELMATRGYLGEQVLGQRRRIVSASDADRQRNAALNRAGYRVGEVMWPSD